MIFTFSPLLLNGQQTPLYPVSYRIFSPYIFNPAIAGSKDFFAVDILAGKYDKSNSQVISGTARLPKPVPEYVSAPGATEFTNIGVGGIIFNEFNGLSRDIGISGTGSYHFQLDREALSFLSFGLTARAVYNDYSGEPDQNRPANTRIYPNVDLGTYYYNKSIYAGFSVTNLLGNPEGPDSLGFYSVPASRQFFLNVGCKVVINRVLNIVIEPSVIINSDDSLSGEIADMIKPMLKLYAGNFCLGTFLNDFNKYSFFFQYKYPKFYIGTYFELPANSPFYKNPILAEFALGINISAIKNGYSRINHW